MAKFKMVMRKLNKSATKARKNRVKKPMRKATLAPKVLTSLRLKLKPVTVGRVVAVTVAALAVTVGHAIIVAAKSASQNLCWRKAKRLSPQRQLNNRVNAAQDMIERNQRDNGPNAPATNLQGRSVRWPWPQLQHQLSLTVLMWLKLRCANGNRLHQQ